MPERLQPECMTRLYELKSCVVRALYYMYPPLAAKYYENINKLNLISQFSNTISLDLHFLFRRKCTSIWCESKVRKLTFEYLNCLSPPYFDNLYICYNVHHSNYLYKIYRSSLH